MSIFDDILTDPRAMNAIGSGFDVGGAIVGGLSHLQFGRQAQHAAVFQAQQLRENAGQQMAGAQRVALDIDQQSQYIASAALASAAASGGGASDPTVVGLMAHNASAFAYRKAVALYQGEDRARLMREQADAREYEGGMTESNSRLVGTAQLLQGGTNLLKGMARDASLYQRFGGGGLKQRPDGDL